MGPDWGAWQALARPFSTHVSDQPHTKGEGEADTFTDPQPVSSRHRIQSLKYIITNHLTVL